MNERSTYSRWDRIDTAADSERFESYLDTVTGLERIQALKRRSHRLLAPSSGDTLLDVGCGTGDDVRALLDVIDATGRVIGVDNSASMIAEARGRTTAQTASFQVADAERLPLKDATVDGARADRVLQHLETPRRAVAELRRVTRPGGRVVVTDSDWGSMTVDAPAIATDRTASILDPDWSCAQNGRIGRKLRRWAIDAGLTDIDIDTATLVLTDFDTADHVLGLTGRIQTMQDTGVLSSEDGDRWLEQLRTADADGVFWSTLDLITVAGTVPA